jgi:hypothetical protein
MWYEVMCYNETADTIFDLLCNCCRYASTGEWAKAVALIAKMRQIQLR